MTAPRRVKKATFTLDEAVLEEAKAVVRNTDYKSLNAFVEMAIVALIKRHRKEEIKRQLVAASRDPLFLADIAAVQRDFQEADWESLEQEA
jgi:hypothetical protein